MNISIPKQTLVGEPEAIAMLLAFYSRSHKSIDSRLDSIDSNMQSVKDSLNKFYIGYGHESIADCATVPVFIEGVSLLAAKQIEDFPLFNGQETSTRYVDFKNQGFVTDKRHPELDHVMTDSINLMSKCEPVLITYLKDKYPQGASDSVVWDRAIKARAFDILRGLIPCGFKTQVGINTTFRQYNSHFNKLKTSVLPEVAEMASEVLKSLAARFPSAIIQKEQADDDLLYTLSPLLLSPSEPQFAFNKMPLAETMDLSYNFTTGYFGARSYQKFPILDSMYAFSFTTHLDFGGWRDLHRHRRVNTHLSYFGSGSLEGEALPFNFHSWYTDNMPEDMANEVNNFVYATAQEVDRAYQYEVDELSSYYRPLGTRVNSTHFAPINAFVYMLAIRSTKGVHPILRSEAQRLYNCMKDAQACIIPFDIDNSDPNEFFVSRGNSTITDQSGKQID